MGKLTRRTAPRIAVSNGQPTTTSRDIADTFGKRHDDVLKRIRTLNCSAEFNARNFSGVEYIDAKGETRQEYQITKDGFAFLCMGFTGAKAAAWKEKYIAHFNRMAEQLAQKHSAPKSVALIAQSDASRIGRGLPPLPAGLAIPPEIAAQIEQATIAMAMRCIPALRTYLERRLGRHCVNSQGWIPEFVPAALANASLGEALNYHAHRDLQACASNAQALATIATESAHRIHQAASRF